MARSLLNATTDSVFLLDKDGHFLTVNKVAAQYLNKTTDELLGECCFDLFSSEVAERRRKILEKVILTAKPLHFTDERDGRFFDANFYPVMNIHGELKSIAVYARDITEQKQAKDALEASQLKLETIFQSIPEGIVTLDPDMKIIQKNKPLDNMCSLFRETEIGSIVKKPSENCHGECLNILRHTLNTRQPLKEYHLDCNFNKESARNLIITSSPLLNPSNSKFEGAILVIRDITRLTELESQILPRISFENIIGASQKMQRVYTLIRQVANLDTTILITGESGTGKELVMEAIHAQGIRSSGPLVRINCSALPETLLESELFGHVKGAFSGAVSDRIGRFQAADHGTIFLDEIGDLSPHIQLKLLRVLERKEFEKVGDSKTCKTDVRIIAATHVNLAEKVRQGKFREDFYYRLGVMTIYIPPLREHKDDIPVLADHFCSMFSELFDKDFKRISDDMLDIFMQYPWHGNVREMKYVMERACILCPGGIITPEYLPPELTANVKAASCSNLTTIPFFQSPAWEQEQTEPHSLNRDDILEILERTDWNKAKAARLLGVSRSTLYRKILEFGIESS